MQPMPTLLGMPEQIARYQLLSELGRGSMGHVYLALDPNIDRKVAIKIFLPLLKVGAAEQWELRQRFVLEARAAGQVNHPGIVTIFDADTDPDTGLSYLAMEWVNGPSLDDLIRESAPLVVERSVTIVEAVAVALDAAHRQGLVHRDIKPANILLESDGRAKVTDFGIAKLASMSITTTGWIPGSPFYMSPEQIRNENIDRRSDLYALGAVLYQCLTGALPFEAESLAALTHMILEIDPRPVRSINPQVSEDLAAVIDTALAKSPDDRFDSGREFARALKMAGASRFKRKADSGRIPAAVASQDAAEASIGDLGVAGGTGTIGLGAGAEEGPQDEASAEPPAAAEVEGEEPEANAGAPLEPDAAPTVRETDSHSGLGRVGLAIGVVLVLMMVAWSLRPVASEPNQGPPALAMLFSSTPRFSEDVAPAGGEIDLPTQPPKDLESTEPAGSVAAVAPRMPVRRPAASPAEPAAVVTESSADPTTQTPPAAPPRPAVRATSTLEIVYRNRLKNALLSVFVDGERLYAGSVSRTPGFFNRTVGTNVWTSLDLTPGEHVVDVRVTGTEGKLDLVRQVTASFEDGRTHRLRITVTRLKNLKLSWKDSPND